ncbi:MAG TPA: hypothetical protein VFM74_03010, partial [Candidatus Limnocylindria bacterium]|nr:hypothetical protein [Candidatus Limnocylindria bacterium]
PLEKRQLAVDDHDLITELGLPPGPRLGRLLERLFEAVIDEPARNRREELLELARTLLASVDQGGASAPRDDRQSG